MDVANDYFDMDLEGCSPEEEIKRLSDYYEKLPEPKVEIHGSYLFVKHIGENALEINDFDLAEKWGLIGLKYKGIYGLLGEEEFFMGKVYFAKGEMEKAKEYFTKVKENSGWRLFNGENPDYKKLVQGKL